MAKYSLWIALVVVVLNPFTQIGIAIYQNDTTNKEDQFKSDLVNLKQRLTSDSLEIKRLKANDETLKAELNQLFKSMDKK